MENKYQLKLYVIKWNKESKPVSRVWLSPIAL